MKRAKTNSGEKEGASAAVAQPASAPVLVQVHLWTEPSGADVPPPSLAMVADLLQVRGGELRDAPADSIAASFPDPVLAVNAARNLQRLVEGFARAWHGADLRSCTTVTRADEAQAKVDPELLHDIPALKQTHPGQVIFAGSLCDAARSIPGLEFRSIPGADLAQNGVILQALQLLPPLRMEGYVEQPFEPKVITQQAPAAAPPTVAEPAITPRPPAYVLVSSPPSGKSAAAPSAVTPPSGSMLAVPFGATRATPPEQGPADEVGAFSREEKASGSKLPRWAILGGAAAAVLAGVLIFTFKRPSPPTPAPVQQQAEPAQAAQPAAAVPEPASAPPASEVRTPAPVVATKAKGNETGHGKGASHAADPSASVGDSATGEDIRPHGLTFTPAEISSLIAHADRDSGNGAFDKAIQEYRLALSREPSNDLAKRGLARALYNKEHR